MKINNSKIGEFTHHEGLVDIEAAISKIKAELPDLTDDEVKYLSRELGQPRRIHLDSVKMPCEISEDRKYDYSKVPEVRVADLKKAVDKVSGNFCRITLQSENDDWGDTFYNLCLSFLPPDQARRYSDRTVKDLITCVRVMRNRKAQEAKEVAERKKQEADKKLRQEKAAQKIESLIQRGECSPEDLEEIKQIFFK
jgi:hypothetical protein